LIWSENTWFTLIYPTFLQVNYQTTLYAHSDNFLVLQTMLNLNFILEVGNWYDWNGQFSYDLWGSLIEFCLRFLAYYKFFKVSDIMKAQGHYSTYASKFCLLHFIAKIRSQFSTKSSKIFTTFRTNAIVINFQLKWFRQSKEATI